MGKVSFHYLDRKLPLKNKLTLKRFIQSIFKREKKALKSIDYIFCSDEHLLQMNKQHLNHDYYTDIITFELGEEETEAEVYISADRVLDNARTHSTSPSEEFLRVMFHGALHLCGYKDKKKSEIELMRDKENEYLRLYSKYK
jgi:probable rRNA maturation factor